MWCISNNKKNSEVLFLANQIVGIFALGTPYLNCGVNKTLPLIFSFLFLAGSTHFLPASAHNTACWSWRAGFPTETRSRHKSHMSSWWETEQSSALFPPFSLSLYVSLCVSHSFPFEFSSSRILFHCSPHRSHTLMVVNQTDCQQKGMWNLVCRGAPCTGHIWVAVCYVCLSCFLWVTTDQTFLYVWVGFLLLRLYLKLQFCTHTQWWNSFTRVKVVIPQCRKTLSCI